MEIIKDHLGNEFENEKLMCRYHHIHYSDYKVLRRFGKSITQILTSENLKYKTNGVDCTDHIGNKFNTITTMCEYWGIPTATYYKEFNRGEPLYQIFEKPRRTNRPSSTYHIKRHTKSPICFINGKEYYSLRSIAISFNVPTYALYSSMKKYNSIEKSLKDCIVRYHEMCKSNIQS